MSLKYLIFGGSGFVGTHLSNYLEDVGSSFLIADLIKPIKQGLSFEVSDVRENISLNIEKNPETIIINFAAIHITPGHKDEEYFETNIKGAENICNFARKNDINTILFTSSISPYGASEEVKKETTLPMPNTPYGISKLVAEEIHKRWQAEIPDKRKLIILRPGVVFGQNEGGNFTRLYQAMSKGFFFYPGRKDTKKACIYVKDLITKMVEMVEKTKPGVHLYNMCYPEPYSLEEICETMATIAQIKPPKFLIPAWFLKFVAFILFYVGRLVGKKIMGIHPDRINKLLISTNINGNKLLENGYHLNYSLVNALEDWYNECQRKGLK